MRRTVNKLHVEYKGGVLYSALGEANVPQMTNDSASQYLLLWQTAAEAVMSRQTNGTVHAHDDIIDISFYVANIALKSARELLVN
jgi:hypothetical protein